MKRNLWVLGSLIATLVVLMVVSLSVAFAADIVPSLEITGVVAQDECDNGIVLVQYFLNHNGVGSVHGYMGRDGVGAEGGFQIAKFDNLPFGQSQFQFNVPGAVPANTIFYIELWTYDQPWNAGTRTFYSKVYFNCSTGEQIGEIVNQAYPDRVDFDLSQVDPAVLDALNDAINNRPSLEVTPVVDGPRIELPGDIRMPVNFGRLGLGG